MDIRFESIQDFFLAIDNTKYLVLRNFDTISDNIDEITDDIDFLCESCEDFIRLTGAKKCRNEELCHNYYVTICDKKIRVDIRYVGDGYYDRLWEQNMIENRIKKGNIYILNKCNYVYSLLYHALLQKYSFSDKYYEIINKIINLDTKNSIKGCILLAKYMKKHGYKIVYPKDPYVTMNKRNCRMFALVYKIIVSKK